MGKRSKGKGKQNTYTPKKEVEKKDSPRLYHLGSKRYGLGLLSDEEITKAFQKGTESRRKKRKRKKAKLSKQATEQRKHKRKHRKSGLSDTDIGTETVYRGKKKAELSVDKLADILLLAANGEWSIAPSTEDDRIKAHLKSTIKLCWYKPDIFYALFRVNRVDWRSREICVTNGYEYSCSYKLKNTVFRSDDLISADQLHREARLVSDSPVPRQACKEVTTLWHGAKAQYIISIIENGLRPGNHGLLGGAIYLTPTIGKAWSYNSNYRCDTRFIIEVKCRLGAVKEHNYGALNGSLTKETVWKQGFQSAYAGPDNAREVGAYSGRLQYKEYAVYDTRQVKVITIHRFDKVPPKPVSKYRVGV